MSDVPKVDEPVVVAPVVDAPAAVEPVVADAPEAATEAPAAEAAPAAEETPAAEAKPVEEGVLGYKGPGLLKYVCSVLTPSHSFRASCFNDVMYLCTCLASNADLSRSSFTCYHQPPLRSLLTALLI